jgi:tRNA(Ile)-lysidine synthase
MVNFKETVLQFLFAYYIPNPYQPIVVGCSGGADSLCLLHLLKSQFSQIIVAHFNHRLRVEADEEANYTIALAKEMGLEAVVDSSDVRSFAVKEKRGIEEAARMLRYKFLFRVARKYHAQAVAVGHHADDQVETVLLHFLRGTGSSGLKGMLPVQWIHPWDSKIPLIRPLLSVWKKDIFEYCRENHLTPLVDQSNSDLVYLRNRLRHVLIPLLESEYNAQIKQCIWQMAQVLAVEVEFIEEVTEQAWQQCVLSAAVSEIVVSAEKFKQLHLAVQRKLLRRAIWRIFPDMRDIDYETTQRGLEFIKNCNETQPKRSRKLHLLKRTVYLL